MANSIHKGSEFNNISETWDQNERKRDSSNAPRRENSGDSGAVQENNLEQVIRQEAAEYDNEAKENRLLSGERASVNDDENAGEPSN